MRIICGCGASFMRSGIRNHQQQSDDPLCKERTFGNREIDGMEDFEVEQRGDFLVITRITALKNLD